MELEFRNKDGKHLFTLCGDSAESAYLYLLKLHQLDYGNKTTNKGTFKTFTCNKLMGYQLFNIIKFTLEPGDYIKVIM